MRAGLIALIAIVVGVLILINTSLFVLNPTQQALILQFGQVRRAVTDPGLYFKIPFVQNVLFLDKRILDLDVPAQEIIAQDQKRLVVDAFARYKIQNPVLFYQSVNNIAEGASRLSTFMQSALRAVLADATFTDIVRDDRPELMERIRKEVQTRAGALGINVVDVRIRRADLPEANSQAIFRRMQTERQQEATEIRAEGEEAAQRIRAQADRQATVTIAEANREAEQVRGQGDAERSSIFADAYNRDPGFFAFYRSMQAYEQSLNAGDTRMVLSPKSEFFRYFNSPTGGLPAPAPAAANPPAASVGAPEGASAVTDQSALDAQVESEVRAVEEKAAEETKAAEEAKAAEETKAASDGSGKSDRKPAAPAASAAPAAPAAPASAGAAAGSASGAADSPPAATGSASSTDTTKAPSGAQ